MEKIDIPLLEKNDVITEKIFDEKNLKSSNSQEITEAIFVIHEHHATRLHWDLRLEMGGVLRSWTVPKDPIDVNYGTRRLAIQVEDHPIEYANFEGEIPTGMYGAGTVKIYDRGEFKLIEDKGNSLTFELKGNKMIGRYSLIKTPNLGKNSWLLLKKK